MSELPLFWLNMLCFVTFNAATFLHESSYIELMSPHRDANFGYSLAYDLVKKRLVVGAPHADINGKVFSCPISGVTKLKTLKCEQLNVDIEKLVTSHTRSGSPDQHYCLGASVAVTPTYVFTCAPLLTKNITGFYGPYGTCFIVDEKTSYYYNGLTEQLENGALAGSDTVNIFIGGVGWTTLSDANNKLILIPKSLQDDKISYIDSDNPSLPADVINFSNAYKYQATVESAVAVMNQSPPFPAIHYSFTTRVILRIVVCSILCEGTSSPPQMAQIHGRGDMI